MANTPIDSLLQLTVPSRATIDLAPPSTSQDAAFDEYFNRAAQNTAPQGQSRSESDRNPHYTPLTADQRDANSNSSLPDDSQFQTDPEGDLPAKGANVESAEDPQEELPASKDVVEISGTTATQTIAEQLSETYDKHPEATQADREESPEEDSVHAATESSETTETAANQPNLQTVSRDNEPALPETSSHSNPELASNSELASQPELPANPELASSSELTVELDTLAAGQQATSTHAQSTNDLEAETQQAAQQDAPVQQAARNLDPSNPTKLQSGKDFESKEPSTPAMDDGPKKRIRETTTNADASDKSANKDRQVTPTTNLSPGVEIGPGVSQLNDADSASTSKLASTADTPVPPSTSSLPPTEVVDRALDRLAVPRSIQPAGQTSEQTFTSTVDRTRFVGRVSSAIRLAQQRDGQLQLRLSPPELGSLRLEISVKQGVLTATLETETAAARQILLENLPALRERLAGQEIRIERFDVDVRREGGEQSQNRAAQERPGDQAQGRQNFPKRQADQQKLSERSIQPLALGVTQPNPDGLDVVI